MQLFLDLQRLLGNWTAWQVVNGTCNQKRIRKNEIVNKFEYKKLPEQCSKKILRENYFFLIKKIFLLASGQIYHKNYQNHEHMQWSINSNCETVHIISTLFKTYQRYNYKDIVTIDGIEYSGERKVNQIVPKNFTINFSSDKFKTDKGFIIKWSCTEWAEWDQASDGTCNEEKRPIINGNETVGLLKYRKLNSTCSK